MCCLTSRQQKTGKTCRGNAQDDKTLCTDGMTKHLIKVCLATFSLAINEKKSALFVDDGMPDDFEDMLLVTI